MAHVDLHELAGILAVNVDSWLEDFTAEQVARAMADAFVARTGRRLLIIASEPPQVLDESILKNLERQVDGAWLSARAVWLASRGLEPYDHQTSINLGRQLSARYRKQRKIGPTRQYWIEAPAITDAKV